MYGIRFSVLHLYHQLPNWSWVLLGGGASSDEVPTNFVRFLAPLGPKKKWRANDRPKISQENKTQPFRREIKTPNRVLKPKNNCLFQTTVVQIVMRRRAYGV